MDVLAELRIQLDGFCRSEATLRNRFAAGLASGLPLTALFSEFPLFSRPESYAAAKEALGSAGTPESARPYLRRWVLFLAEQVLASGAAEGEEAQAKREAQEKIPLPVGTACFIDAEAALLHEPSRERRAQTEGALSGFLLAHAAPSARAVVRTLELAPSLGHASLAALHAEVLPGESSASAEACEALLRQTQDAYADVLAFALRRVDPQLRAAPSGQANAARHDLRFAAQTPWMRSHFAPAEVVPAITRCTSDVGFHPTAGGRIHRDVADRAGKRSGPSVFAVEVPGEVHLGVRLSCGGQAEFAALLEATGQALRLAHLPATGSVEARRLADVGLTLAHGLVWRSVLTYEGWHRRYLGASTPGAREAARLSALFLLADLRADCARRLYAEELLQRGPTGALADAYVTRMTDALGVQVPPGEYLRDAGSLWVPERLPGAWARAGELLTTLEARFNEDFYRNPACGAWLESQWQNEGRALALPAPQPAPPVPSLLEMGTRLVRVLGA